MVLLSYGGVEVVVAVAVAEEEDLLAGSVLQAAIIMLAS